MFYFLLHDFRRKKMVLKGLLILKNRNRLYFLLYENRIEINRLGVFPIETTNFFI